MGSLDDGKGVVATDMTMFYRIATGILVALCAAVAARDCLTKCKDDLPPDARRLQRTYLTGFLICAAADWLQGPYVYALYAAYGFPSFTLALLFVTGFSTSMIFGPFVGTFADRFGRKRSILVCYCAAYVLACITKHFSDLAALMAGRVLSGIATSALFSSFESWLVGEHTRLALPKASLDAIFSNMYFGNGLVAILMGVVAQLAADAHEMEAYGSFHLWGYLAPFDLALLLCCVAGGLIAFTWAENKQDPAEAAAAGGGSWLKKARHAFGVLFRDPLLMLIMLVASLVEGAMYAFIFDWTPALSTAERSPPHGLIFACFMLAYMIGSCAFSMILQRGVQPATVLAAVAAVAAASLALAWLLHLSGAVAHDAGTAACFVGFLLFEAAVGMYMPLLASIKARFVPEEVRASLYTIFRIPLNFIVVVVLLSNLPLAGTFLLCTLLTAGATASAVALRSKILQREAAQQVDGVDGSKETDSLLSKGV